jgi:hypothetical protein
VTPPKPPRPPAPMSVPPDFAEVQFENTDVTDDPVEKIKIAANNAAKGSRAALVAVSEIKQAIADHSAQDRADIGAVNRRVGELGEHVHNLRTDMAGIKPVLEDVKVSMRQEREAAARREKAAADAEATRQLGAAQADAERALGAAKVDTAKKLADVDDTAQTKKLKKKIAWRIVSIASSIASVLTAAGLLAVQRCGG